MPCFSVILGHVFICFHLFPLFPLYSTQLNSTMLAPIFLESDPSLISQFINITTMDGVVQYNIQELDSFQTSRMIFAALFGVRAGVSAIVSIILFLLVDRRTTPVYIFNQVSLVLMFIQSTLFLVNLVSPYGLISTVFTQSYAAVTQSNVNVSVASSVFQLLFIITIQCSLFFQGRIIFPKASPSRLLATVILGIISLATVVLYSLYIAQSCHAAINPADLLLFGVKGKKLPSMAQIMFASSISFCTLIFVGKLVFAIRTRWVLGLKQFGPLQIICIMGAQSMIIPAIITVVSFARPDVQSIYSVASFVVVISLPLSAMWAASANTSTKPSSTSYYLNAVKDRRGMSDMSAAHYQHNNHHDTEKGPRPPHNSSAKTSVSGVWSEFKAVLASIFTPSGPSDLASRRRHIGLSPINVNSARGPMDESSPNSARMGYTGDSATGFMSRNSLEAQAPDYGDKYRISTRVSITNIDLNSLDSAECRAHQGHQHQHQHQQHHVHYREAPDASVIEYTPETTTESNISPLTGVSRGMGIIMGSAEELPLATDAHRAAHLV